MGYDISGVKNAEHTKSKSSGVSVDSSYWDNLKKTDKSSRARIISEGKDEVESFDVSYDFGEDKYDTLSSKGEAYLSYKADSDVNAAGAKEVSLATSADNAKDGNFVNSVITDEDVWKGTIKF